MTAAASNDTASASQDDSFPDTSTTTPPPPPTTTTRVCIKNVPPSFANHDLRQHLLAHAKQLRVQSDFTVTDCRILKTPKGKSRHMAFVGVKTPDMAAWLVQTLHRTYARTSRLHVEPAYSSQTQQQQQQNNNNIHHRPWSQHSKGSSRYQNSAAPKHAPQENTSDNASFKKKNKKENVGFKLDETELRKREFLAAMGGERVKFWSNDDGAAFTENEQDDVELRNNDNDEKEPNNSDNNNDNNDNNDDDDNVSVEAQDVHSDESSVASATDSLDSGGRGADVLLRQTRHHGAAVVSDMDFLRSKVITDAEELSVPEEESISNNEDEDDDDDNNRSVGGRNHQKDDVDKPPTAQEENVVMDEESSIDSDSSAGDSESLVDSEDSERKVVEDSAPTKSEAPQTLQSVQADTKHLSPSDTSQYAPNRLFVRNLPFATTEQELQEHFSQFGTVTECHIPVDDQKRHKGFAFVMFDTSDSAQRARTELDGTDFQGRLLHILPAKRGSRQEENTDGIIDSVSKLTYKQKQELERRKDAMGSNNKGWSASFVRGDAVVDNLADRLGIHKGDLLNVKDGLTSGEAAVRLALGETHIIEENRDYFRKEGVDMDALVSAKGDDSNKRSTTCILVKNLPYDTELEELTKLFHNVGGDAPTRILLPPSRTIAMVEYGHATDARRAFRKLAYRRFKHVPLYLEWAPLAAQLAEGADKKTDAPEVNESRAPAVEEEAIDEAVSPGISYTIYVKNLNFGTSEEKLRSIFERHVKTIRAVKIPTKLAPVKKGQTNTETETRSLSLGYGFVECDSEDSVRQAIQKLQGIVVDGHALELKRSSKAVAPHAPRSDTKTNPTKLVVRNVPFQASRKELLQLFGSFGQLKKVRLPKKFDGSHRGFAFVEYLTGQEAQTAMTTLSRTHLYGRHLVLEWASDKDDIDTLREKAKRDAVSTREKEAPKNKKIKFSY